MSGSGEKFSVRLALEGGQDFTQQLQRAGQAGQTAMAQIAQGATAAGAATETAGSRVQALATVFQRGVGAVGEFNDKLGQGHNALGLLLQSGAGLLSVFGPAGAIAGAALGFAAVQLGVNGARATVEELTAAAREGATQFGTYLQGLQQYGRGAVTAANEVLQLREAIGRLSETQQAAEQIRLQAQAREAEGRLQRARDQIRLNVEAERPQDVNLVPRGWEGTLTQVTRALGIYNVDFERARENTNAFQDALGRLFGELRQGNTVWLQSAETQRTLAQVLEQARAATNIDDLSRLIERLQALAQQGGATGEAAGRLRDSLFPVLDAMRQLEQANARAETSLGRVSTEAGRTAQQFLTLRAAAIGAANGTDQVEAGIRAAARLNDAFQFGGRAGLEAQQRDERITAAVDRARTQALAGERAAIQAAATRGGGERLSDEALARELNDPGRQARIAGIAQRARDEEARTIAREDANRGGGGARPNDTEARELERLAQQYRQLQGALDPVVRINNQYAESQRLLDDALQRGVATQESYDNDLRLLSERRNRDLQQLREQTDEYRRSVQAAEQDAKALGAALGTAFEGAVIQGKDLKSVIKSLEQDLLRLLTRRLVSQPLNDWLSGALGGGGGGKSGSMAWDTGAVTGGGGGGAGGLIGGLASWITSLFHEGGEAGFASMTRSAHPALFHGAPRYHSGGFAGLMPGEVPAILKMGERIRTPEQEAALAANIRGGAARRGAPIVMNFHVADANSLVRSRAQVTRELGQAVRVAQRNL